MRKLATQGDVAINMERTHRFVAINQQAVSQKLLLSHSIASYITYVPMNIQAPVTPTPQKPYFAPIDGVRSLCVLLVVEHHLKTNGHPLAFPAFIDTALGVNIFFVISGFLITTLLLREERLKGKISFSAFYWRRAFRILPVYSVVLLMYVAVSQLPSQAMRWVQLKAGMPYFLLFMNEYAKEPNNGNVFTHTWSLGIEEKFYLLWPVLFFFVVKKMPTRAIMLVCLSILFAIPVLLHLEHHPNAYFGLLAGCIMAVLLHGDATAAGITQTLRRISSPVMLLFYLLCFYLQYLNSNMVILFSIGTALCLSYLIVKPTWLTTLLSLPLLVWLGKRSYSMYLVHVLCLNVFENIIHINSQWQAVLVLGASYALSAAVAAVLYVIVEEPARQLGKRFVEQKRMRATTLGVATG
ncbi:peptidoglycan/LPS O-acetylase OafA/YrhL [Granulicella arctica]|uniref:Peptidoglycan/LPS O-acetylase OafA/YrhL n=2 Tax=Granulicella arctica TaxID=940613 RepID=A0A7Y9TMP4_9BACT|nr:peptidoglycan/LPS O-acetylase OafA/YrhL [Granulicella arctica]